MLELLTLAAPTVAQMTSYTLMQFADRLMLARVGDLEAAASGTAGIVFFAVLSFGFGVLILVNALASQVLGRGDLSAAGQFMWQGLWFGILLGLLPLMTFPFAQQIFQAMGHEAHMASLEGDYFRIVCLGGAVKLAQTAMSSFLLGLHRPGIVLVGAIGGAVANLFFNWLLIYGNWGFPALGVAGAAWGTNAAVTVELIVMGAYVFRPVFAARFNTYDFRLRFNRMRMLLKIGVPSGCQFINDVLAWAIFMNVILGKLGTAALSANSFAFTYMSLCFMPAAGVGAAVTALVGRYIGMGRSDLAERRAHLGFFACAIYMTIAGITLYVFRYQLIGLFTHDEQIKQIGGQLLLFIALYQLFDAMFLIYMGALRGAGDTLVPAIVQGILIWTIVVGGGSLFVYFAPGLGVKGPWSLTLAFGICLGFYLMGRFHRGNWKKIRLHDEPIPSTELLPISV